MPNTRISIYSRPAIPTQPHCRCRIHQPLFLVRYQPISFPRICDQNLDGAGGQMIRGSIGNGVLIETIQPELALGPPFSPVSRLTSLARLYSELHTVPFTDWEASVRILFDFPFATATQHAAQKKKEFCETVIIRRSVSVARC